MQGLLSNKEIAAQFELLAELLELSGENAFKVKSYSIAAFRISKLPTSLMEMHDADIKKIENIGPAIIARIDEIRATGTMQALQELMQSTPAGIIELLQVKGLGAKKIRQLWLELEIESIGELLYACQENRLITLKGFGKKTQENILNNIHFILSNKDKFLYAEAYPAAVDILEDLLSKYPDHIIHITGDIARQMPVIHSIDYLSDLSTDQWNHYFEDKYGQSFIETGDHWHIQLPALPRIILRKADADRYAAMLFRLNSSDAFYEYFTTRYQVPAGVTSEEEIFQSHQLAYIPPARREQDNIPQLISGNIIPPILPTDIKGLIHCHSTWSDGLHSIRQMAEACIRKGWEYMVLTDHSVSAFYANGLTAERIAEQHKEIEELNRELAPFRILKGIEADIQYSGSLDYDESVWQSFDLIIASVHSNLRMTPEKATERVLKALDNPYVTILGHPTGRLLLSRDGYPVDMKAVIDKCAEKNIIIEINAHPRRLDLDWQWVNYALSKGLMLSINPDAHSAEGIDMVTYGVTAAQKTMLGRERNLSSLSLAELLSYLEKQKVR